MFDELDGHMVHVADRDIYDGATDLIACFGAAADIEAAARARVAQEVGNVYHCVRWRQIERLIPVLMSDEVKGTLH